MTFKSKNKEKDKESLVEKVVSINKVSKTTKGGKSLSFSILIVAGDKKGKAGFATGKARDVTVARAKAFKRVKRYLVKIPLREGRTLHHDCSAKFGASRVLLRPAVPGTGIIAGDSIRAVLECLGVQDVVAKSLGSANARNVVIATFMALKGLNSPKKIALRRNKHISDVIKKRNIALKTNNNEEEKQS